MGYAADGGPHCDMSMLVELAEVIEAGTLGLWR